MNTNLATLGALLKGGNSAKFDAPGDTHTGTIDNISVQQATDINTGEPLTWDNGQPRMQVLVAIQSKPVDADDDGTRTVWVKTWGESWKNFRAAVRETYGTKGEPQPGDIFTATYIGDGEAPKRGFNAPKILDFTFEKRTPGLAGALAEQNPASADAEPSTPAAPAAPAQPAPASAPATQPLEIVKQYIQLGWPDSDIANTTGLDETVIANVRSSM